MYWLKTSSWTDKQNFWLLYRDIHSVDCLCLHSLRCLTHLHRSTVITCSAEGWGRSDRPAVTSGPEQTGRLTQRLLGPPLIMREKVLALSPCPSGTAQPAPSNAASTSVTFGCCSVRWLSSQVRSEHPIKKPCGSQSKELLSFLFIRLSSI